MIVIAFICNIANMKTIKSFYIICLLCVTSLNLQGQDTTASKKIQDIPQNVTDTIVFYNLAKYLVPLLKSQVHQSNTANKIYPICQSMKSTFKM